MALFPQTLGSLIGHSASLAFSMTSQGLKVIVMNEKKPKSAKIRAALKNETNTPLQGTPRKPTSDHCLHGCRTVYWREGLLPKR
jgi:hypothetical protein